MIEKESLKTKEASRESCESEGKVSSTNASIGSITSSSIFGTHLMAAKSTIGGFFWRIFNGPEPLDVEQMEGMAGPVSGRHENNTFMSPPSPLIQPAVTDTAKVKDDAMPGKHSSAMSTPLGRLSSSRPSTAASQSDPGSPIISRPTSYYLEDSDYGIVLEGRSANNAFSADGPIMTPVLIAHLHTGLPPRWRLCSHWRLLYSTAQHGFSLMTLYSRSEHFSGPVLLACRETASKGSSAEATDSVFGIVATEPWKPHLDHFGTGECFLWRAEANASSGSSVESEATLRVKKYGTTGKNNYFLMAEKDFLAAGCGEGRFGIWLDQQLLKGTTHKVPTFDNDVLARAEAFECVSLELWGLVP